MNPTHIDINAHKLASFADSFPSRPSNTQSEQESPIKPTSQVFRFRDSTGQGSDPESPQTGYFPNTTTEEGSSPEKAQRENSSPSEIDSSNMALPDQQNTENKKKKNKRSLVFHIEGEDSEPNPDDEEEDEESSPEVRPRARNDRVIYSPKGTMIGTKTQNKTEQKNYSSEEDEDSSPEISRSRNTRVVFSPRGGDYVKNTEIETSDGVTVIRKKILNQSFQEPPKPKRKSDPISPRTYQEQKKKIGTNSVIYSRTQDKNSIIIPEQNKFLDPSQWSENLKCYVCDRVFDKTQGIHTHHCRACGRSVCGDCSRKKINSDRACDVCYKKVVDVSGEGARNKRLMEKMALLQAKEKYLQEAKQNFQELQKKRKEMEKIWMTELTDQANKSRALQDEKRQENEDLQKKLLENEKLREELQVTQKFLREKEEANSEVQELLLCVKSELSKQKKAKDNKLQEFENLVEDKRSYNPSVVSCLGFGGETDTSFTRDPKNVGSCDPNYFRCSIKN